MLTNLRDIFEKEDNAKIQNILSIIYMHKEKCIQEYCKCKFIHISPYGKEFKENYVSNFMLRMTFLIETAFVEIDYTKDFEITLLLSEIYYIFHKNPIMAYSFIQTLLHLNKKLSISQILNLYEVSQKYIEYYMEQENKKVREISLSSSKTKDGKEKNKQEIIKYNKNFEMRDIFLTLDKIVTIENYYVDYSSNFLSILREKYKFDMSLKIETYKDNIAEISNINNNYLTNSNIKILLYLLQIEIKNKKEITKLISSLELNNLPIFFIYQSLLFYYYLLGGTLEKEVIPVLYSFTNDHNLYSTKVKKSIFPILLSRFKKSNLINKSRFEAIFECTKGIQCSYASPQLIEILQFKSKDLHNLDLESFLPKYLSIPHTNHIIRILIYNKQIVNLNKIAYLFNSKSQLYKVDFDGNVITGLSKNIILFVSCVLLEKPREYYFLLNQNCELFSLSENFYKDYGVSLNFLEKWQINILDLFGIKTDNIFKQFLIYNQKLKDYKMKLNLTTGEYFLKKIFKNNEKFLKNDRSNYLLEDYLNINNNINNRKLSNDFDNDNDNDNDNKNNNNLTNENKNDEDDDEKVNLYQGLINVRKKLEDIYNNNNNKKYKNYVNIECKESKINFITKVYNIFKELADIDIHDKSYLLLEKIIVQYRDFYNLNEIKTEQEKLNISKNNYFDINISISLIYDTPFFVIKIKEINLNTLIGFEKNINQEKINIINTNLPKSFGYNDETDTNTVSTSITPIQRNQIGNDNNIIGLSKKKSIFNNVNCMRLIIILLYFILLILVIGDVVIYFYQRKTVNVSKSLFLSLYYNYYQRDDFLHLYSFYISLYYYYMNLTNINSIYNIITLNDFQNIIDEKAINFEECFHNFYMYYIDFNQKTGYSIANILDTFKTEKLAVNWKTNNTKSDYLTEVEFLSYTTKKYKLPKINDLDDSIELSNLLDSGDKLLLGKYKELSDNIKVNSTFIKILYYLTANGNNYNNLFDFLKEKTEDSYLKFTKKSRKIYILLEVIIFVITLLFFFIGFYYLNIYNKIIFSNIIKLFIDEEIISIFKYNEIAKKENFFLLKLIKEFHSLLIDFNMTNIKNFNNLLIKKENIDHNSFKDLEEISNIDNNENKIPNTSNKNLKLNGRNNEIKDLNNDILESKDQKTSVIKDLITRKNSKSKISISSSNLIKNPPLGTVAYLNFGVKGKELLKINDKSEIQENSIMKKKKNVKFQNNDYNKSKNKNNISDNDDNSILSNIKITLETLISKLNYSTIYQIKILYIFLLIFFIGFLLYFILKLIQSLKIYLNITEQFNDFQIIMCQYSNVYNFYNNLLTAIILPKFSNYTLLKSMNILKEEATLKFNELMNYRINNYDHFSILYLNIINSYNEKNITNHHFLICDYDKLKNYQKNTCYKIISSDYTLFDKGLNIGINAIFQEISNIFNDYLAVNEVILNKDDINKYFTSINFIKLYLNTNFIIYKLQDVLYRGFLQEQTCLTNSMNKKALLLNIICLSFYLILIIFVLVFADREVKGLHKIITESTHRIIIAFRNIKYKK